MQIEKLTIDGKQYKVVATDIKNDCERCRLENKYWPQCHITCNSTAFINGVFSVRFEEMEPIATATTTL